MNLTKLFEIQRILDEKIVKEKGLEGQDLLDKKILALQVELGELAQNWRGFKFWSEDQEPRIFVPNPDDVCKNCKGDAYFNKEKDMKEWILCNECDGCGVHFHNPLLEEYVDCLHFILSIGNDLGIKVNTVEEVQRTDITFVFNELFDTVSGLRNLLIRGNEYIWLLKEFINLGKMLGFTWEEVEQGYYAKNRINHERQENGY